MSKTPSSVTTNILDVHEDEVWNVQWSHDGRFLASASKDRTAIIWQISPEVGQDLVPERVLRGHETYITCLAWSLDDSLLLTSAENTIKLWNTTTGLCVRELAEHTDVVTALVWLPDGSGFLSGSMDRRILIWDADGHLRDTWSTATLRLTDLAVTPDSSRLVALGVYNLPVPRNNSSSSLYDSATPTAGDGVQSNALQNSEHRIIIYELAFRKQEASIALDGDLTSVQISPDSRYALVNQAPDEVKLWDLDTARVVRKYAGHRQGRHVIRSCFGGADGKLVVSGSEDGNVYVWHRDSGTLLEVLEGHGAGSVNSVAWNPKEVRMFASCSDDCTVRIWETPSPELCEDDACMTEQSGKGDDGTE